MAQQKGWTVADGEVKDHYEGILAERSTRHEQQRSRSTSGVANCEQRVTQAADSDTSSQPIAPDHMKDALACLPEWVGEALIAVNVPLWRIVLDVGKPPLAYTLVQPSRGKLVPLHQTKPLQPADLTGLRGGVLGSLHRAEQLKPLYDEAGVAGVTLFLQRPLRGSSKILQDVLRPHASAVIVGAAKSGKTT
eukprot:6337482-Amphidinium_carterae.1